MRDGDADGDGKKEGFVKELRDCRNLPDAEVAPAPAAPVAVAAPTVVVDVDPAPTPAPKPRRPAVLDEFDEVDDDAPLVVPPVATTAVAAASFDDFDEIDEDRIDSLADVREVALNAAATVRRTLDPVLDPFTADVEPATEVRDAGPGDGFRAALSNLDNDDVIDRLDADQDGDLRLDQGFDDDEDGDGASAFVDTDEDGRNRSNQTAPAPRNARPGAVSPSPQSRSQLRRFRRGLHHEPRPHDLARGCPR